MRRLFCLIHVSPKSNHKQTEGGKFDFKGREDPVLKEAEIEVAQEQTKERQLTATGREEWILL